MQHGDYTDSAREYIARGRFDSFARPATGADSLHAWEMAMVIRKKLAPQRALVEQMMRGKDVHERGTLSKRELLQVPPPPPPRTKWTRRVPHPVLIGHASSLTLGQVLRNFEVFVTHAMLDEALAYVRFDPAAERVDYMRFLLALCVTPLPHQVCRRAPPPLRTNRTRRVLHPVLIGHATAPPGRRGDDAGGPARRGARAGAAPAAEHGPERESDCAGVPPPPPPSLLLPLPMSLLYTNGHRRATGCSRGGASRRRAQGPGAAAGRGLGSRSGSRRPRRLLGCRTPWATRCDAAPPPRSVLPCARARARVCVCVCVTLRLSGRGHAQWDAVAHAFTIEQQRLGQSRVPQVPARARRAGRAPAGGEAREARGPWRRVRFPGALWEESATRRATALPE